MKFPVNGTFRVEKVVLDGYGGENVEVVFEGEAFLEPEMRWATVQGSAIAQGNGTLYIWQDIGNLELLGARIYEVTSGNQLRLVGEIISVKPYKLGIEEFGHLEAIYQ